MIAKWRVKLDKEQLSSNEYNFELSVVKIGTHGEHSWGWPSDDKIILLEGDVPDHYSEETLNRIHQFALELRDEFNAKDRD